MLPGENVLAAALAAGLPMPHSCRAGRCASCKSRLLSGVIEYPLGTPPGITAAEIAQGDVLLCQAQPRSDLKIESRRVPVRASSAATAEVLALAPLPLGALQIRLKFFEGTLHVRPGQFVDVRNHVGDADRLAVILVGDEGIDLELPKSATPFAMWMSASAVAGTRLRVSGPFDAPR